MNLQTLVMRPKAKGEQDGIKTRKHVKWSSELGIRLAKLKYIKMVHQ